MTISLQLGHAQQYVSQAKYLLHLQTNLHGVGQCESLWGICLRLSAGIVARLKKDIIERVQAESICTLARVMSPSDSAELGDVSDPFRPRYAVNVQLLDENGTAAQGVQEYNAVPLPVPMAGSEGGMFQFPPEGCW